jgi:Protein of unknown function (DUF3341)
MGEKKPKRGIVFALFGPQSTVPPILDRLRVAGVPDTHIDVVSALPLAGVSLHKPVALPLYPIAIIAGLMGIGVGIFFAGGTAALYPLMTGGKAIVALPVVGIISYETMMLVAIVTTFITMAIKIMFTHRSGLGHDPRIDEGAVGISVRVPPGDGLTAVIEGLLRQAGAQEVETR